MRRHIDKIKDANYERGYVYNTNYHITLTSHHFYTSIKKR